MAIDEPKNIRTEVQLMTVAEAADCLRFHPSTVYRLVRGGHLPALKLGKQWRVSRDAIQRLADEGQPLQPRIGSQNGRSAN